MKISKVLLISVLLTLAALGTSIIEAQVPAPQINLTGNIGCQGFPCVNSGTLIMPSDANYSLSAQETSAFYIKVTSAVSLTTTRNIITPTGRFPFTIENATTGGQSIQIIGASGTGVTIGNGVTMGVWNDGTNYVQVGVGSVGPNNFPGTTHQFVTSYDSTTHNLASAQPAFTDISGVATPGQLPNATGSTFGIIKPDGTSCTVTSGVLTCPGSGGYIPPTGTGVPSIVGGVQQVAAITAILAAPSGTQTITQPTGTATNINHLNCPLTGDNTVDCLETDGTLNTYSGDSGGFSVNGTVNYHRYQTTFNIPGWNYGSTGMLTSGWLTSTAQTVFAKKYSQGIGNGQIVLVAGSGRGDVNGTNLQINTNGGYEALSDEGQTAAQWAMIETGGSTGTVVTGGARATTVNLSSVNGGGVGVGRLAIDTSTAGFVTTETPSSSITLANNAGALLVSTLGTAASSASVCGLAVPGPPVTTTGFSITGGVLTITGTNPYSFGQVITLSGYTGGNAYLNGTYSVGSSTGTTFSIFTAFANVAFTSVTASAVYNNVEVVRQAGNAGAATTFGVVMGSPYSVGSPGPMAVAAGLGFISKFRINSAVSYSGGVQYFTANLRDPIFAGSQVCVGGLAGYEQINNTLGVPYYVDVIGNPTTTSVWLGIIRAGFIVGPQVPAGTWTMYPGATITGTDFSSNTTLSLTDNDMASTAGHTITIPDSYSASYTYLNAKVVNNNPFAQFVGLALNYNGSYLYTPGQYILANGFIANNLISQGGNGYAPIFERIKNHVGALAHLDNPPSDSFRDGNTFPPGLLEVECDNAGGVPYAGCNTQYNIWRDFTSGGSDSYLQLTRATGVYNLISDTGTVDLKVAGSSVCRADGTNCPAAGLGTVTNFSAGTLSPLFTTSVGTSTTTPALTFTLSNAAQNSVLAGPPSGGAGAPFYQTAPTFSAANLTGLPLTTGVTGNLPNGNLAIQTANTVLGALTATTPSGLAMPSCSTGTSALTWTTGTGFGCNSISGTSGITGLTAGFIPKAGSATTLTANSALDDGVTTASTITSTEAVNINLAGGAVTTPTNTMLFAANSGAPSRILALTYGGQGFFTAGCFGGTRASPTALTSGTQCGGVNAFMWDGTALGGPGASFRTFANENQAVGAHGSYADIATTPNGSTTLTSVLRFENDGGITTPGVAGGSKGAGSGNFGSLYVGGVAVGGGSAFSAITGGTNTTAAMVVGIGASLDYTGTGTIDANRIGGAAVPTGTAGPTTTNSIGQIVQPHFINSLAIVMDSYGSGTGVAAPLTDSIAANLSLATPAPMQNYSVAGQSNAGNLAPYTSFVWHPVYPSVAVANGNENEAPADACGATLGTNCTNNTANVLRAQATFIALPVGAYRKDASTCTQTAGTWTVDSSILFYAPSLTTSPGTGMKTSSSSAILTCTITTPTATTVAGAMYPVTNAGTGSFTVTVDGVSKNDGCGNATWSSGPCGGQALIIATSGTEFAQEFTGLASSTTHTIVFTTSTTNNVGIHSIYAVPLTPPAYENAYYYAGAPALAAWTNYALYNTVAQGVMTAEHTSGVQAYYVDTTSLTAADFATSATTTCKGSTSGNHPNDCGAYDFANLVLGTAALAGNYQFGAPNLGGVAKAKGSISANIQATVSLNSFATESHQFNVTQTAGPVNLCPFLSASAANAWCFAYIKDASSGKAWSNANAAVMFGTNGWALFDTYDGSGTAGAGHMTAHAGVQLSNGNILSDGTILSTLGTAVITSATPGTGVTSATCQTATCTVYRGSYTVVGGTGTTGTIVTLLWPTTTTAWVCSVVENGGTGFQGLGHSVATATGMTISAGVAVTGVTFTFDYNCVP